MIMQLAILGVGAPGMGDMGDLPDITGTEDEPLPSEDIASKRLGSPYRSGRSAHWVKIKNPKALTVRREAEEDWGR